MKKRIRFFLRYSLVICTIGYIGCASAPRKQYYLINYEPDTMTQRRQQAPWPCILRIKNFSIEEAYARPQIVYRKSPFELEYYFYKVWAVKPANMITDMIEKHFTSVNLVQQVVRRYDDATSSPDYELSGKIESLEEYDNEDTWFAHFSIRVKLTRLSDNKTIYQRLFNNRKQVLTQSPEMVVRELSRIMDFTMTQVVQDIDATLAHEYGKLKNLPSTHTLETQLGPGDIGE